MFETLKSLFKPRGRFISRRRVHDSNNASFTFRMGAGFPGDVSRGEFKVEPCLIDASAPPTAYGQPVICDATTEGVRPFASGDSSVVTTYGFTVRPFPYQSTSYSASFGAATPPTAGMIDIERSGYIFVQLPVGSAATVKGGTVYVWIAASSGNHVQGGIESSASGGNTIALDPTRWSFNGPADANLVAEISNNV